MRSVIRLGVRPLVAALPLLVLFAPSRADAKTVNVTNANELTAALAAAAAGDEIVLAPGTYALSASPVCSAAGTAAAPIVVRSATPLAARVEFNALEGFHVTGPYWTFEGLDVHGVCPNDSDCEHGFHVTGAATGFVMKNNRVVDFNAQLKVNADNVNGTWVKPNGGLVEGNEVFDTHARATSNPVTKLNVDTVDDWIIRANYLHDGHKNGGDNTSYQSFIKGGGKNGLYERNLVVCTLNDTSGGTRIGLSFGGGGTAPQFCAPAFDPNVPCAPEMTGGTMRNNIIVNCSDVGIYLNQSKDSHILFNTMIATNGVDFRFATTSGEADGNVLASTFRTRDGATMTVKTNLDNLAQTDFDAMYVAPLLGDLRKKGDLARLLGKATARADVTDDYCARARSGVYDLGALQASLGDCDTTRPPAGGPSSGDAGAADGSTPAPGSDSGAPGPAADGGGNGEAPGGSDGSSSGCGCRVGGARAPSAFGVVAIAALFALVSRRRPAAAPRRRTAGGTPRRRS